MSTDEIADYLTREITINRTVVTYRSLSRRFTIHVNEAKNQLAKFHAKAAEEKLKIHATYLISGEAAVRKNRMDVDNAAYGESVPRTMMLLVPERDYNKAKTRFQNISSYHVYSLSPAPIRDKRLFRTVNKDVRKIDRAGGKKLAEEVGKIKPSGSKFKPKAGVKGKAKAKPVPVKISRTNITTSATTAPKTTPASTSAPKEASKPKPAGKEIKVQTKLQKQSTGLLDWSKGKTKPTEKAGDGKKKEALKSNESSRPGTPVDKKVKDEGSDAKRGVKRKSEVISSVFTSEPPPTSTSGSSTPATKPKLKQEPVPPTTPLAPPIAPPTTPQPVTKASALTAVATAPSIVVARDAKVKKGVVVSDDEEEEVKKPSKPVIDKSLRAMMDIDDEDVIRVPRARPSLKRPSPAYGEEEEEEEDLKQQPPTSKLKSSKANADEDVTMSNADGEAEPGQEGYESDDPASGYKKPRKKGQKKVVPIGRNGLKKRRVIKTKHTMEEKGYLESVDYSSYESADEEEEEEPPKEKKKISITAKGATKKASTPAAATDKKAKAKTATKDKETDKTKDKDKEASSSSTPTASTKTKKASTEPTKKISEVKKPAPPKPAGAGKIKTQGSLLNFFGAAPQGKK